MRSFGAIAIWVFAGFWLVGCGYASHSTGGIVDNGNQPPQTPEEPGTPGTDPGSGSEDPGGNHNSPSHTKGGEGLLVVLERYQVEVPKKGWKVANGLSTTRIFSGQTAIEFRFVEKACTAEGVRKGDVVIYECSSQASDIAFSNGEIIRAEFAERTSLIERILLTLKPVDA